jgi:hypothetical protein
MKEKEKNIYGIHQYTLTRRRKVRGKKRNIKRKPSNKEGKQKSKRINVLLSLARREKKSRVRRKAREKKEINQRLEDLIDYAEVAARPRLDFAFLLGPEAVRAASRSWSRIWCLRARTRLPT